MRGARAIRVAIRASAGLQISKPSFASARCLALRSFQPVTIYNGQRTLSTTSTLRKKTDNKKKTSAKPSSTTSAPDADAEESSSKHPKPDPSEPLDFADLTSRWQAADEFFAEKVKKLKAGGRFNPDVIGSLRVQPDRKTAETFPLRDLAQVVPKGGRTISILVHESQYIKPVMSAIQASPEFNQQPQRDADNELELVLKIEAESRDEVLKRVKGMCEEYRERIRQARAKRHKQHETWAKDKVVSADLKKTLDKELQKVLEKKLKEADTKEKDALRIAAK